MEPETLADLIEQCAQAGEPDTELASGHACAELLRRALDGDEAAQQAMQQQFGPLVRAWIAAHPLGSDDSAGCAALAEQVFGDRRASGATVELGPRASLADVLAWIKRAVFTVLVDDARQQEVGRITTTDPADWPALAARLPERQQQLAVYLAVVANLRPRAMARQRPEIFSTAKQAIHALRLGLDTVREAGGALDASPCVAPGAIDDDDLVASASDETSRSVRDHLRSCPGCAARAVSYREQLNWLRAALFRADCPAPLAVTRYATGRLAPTEADARHIAHCPHCQAEAATASGFVDTPPTEDLRLLRRLRRIIAQPLPERSGRGRRGAVSLRYTAGAISLTLHPQQADRPRDRVQILGFVEQIGATLESLAGTPVRLLTNGQPIARARLDTIGSFTLGPVAPGSYDLELDTPDGAVVIPGLPAWIEAY